MFVYLNLKEKINKSKKAKERFPKANVVNFMKNAKLFYSCSSVEELTILNLVRYLIFVEITVKWTEYF